MKKGVVLFAFDNEVFKYQKMAEWSTRRIHRHLDLPVTLVTDRAVENFEFDQVIVIDNKSSGSRHFLDVDKLATWHNHSRPQVIDITPYDQTLVLDVDYVVASDRLKILFDIDRDFLCHDIAYDITGLTDYSSLNNFGRNRMPSKWATVMYFEKTNRVAMIFDIMTRVRENYRHYCNLYGIPTRGSYRNDYALSIALNIVDGHRPYTDSIPWRLASVDPQHKVSLLDNDRFKIEFLQDNRSRYIMTDGQDLHIMGKQDLMEIVDGKS